MCYIWLVLITDEVRKLKLSFNFKDSDAIVKEKVEKIIQFARDNNFTLEEKLQLKEILMVPDISETRHGSQDCNHNSFFQKEETVIKKV